MRRLPHVLEWQPHGPAASSGPPEQPPARDRRPLQRLHCPPPPRVLLWPWHRKPPASTPDGGQPQQQASWRMKPSLHGRLPLHRCVGRVLSVQARGQIAADRALLCPWPLGQSLPPLLARCLSSGPSPPASGHHRRAGAIATGGYRLLLLPLHQAAEPQRQQQTLPGQQPRPPPPYTQQRQLPAGFAAPKPTQPPAGRPRRQPPSSRRCRCRRGRVRVAWQRQRPAAVRRWWPCCSGTRPDEELQQRHLGMGHHPLQLPPLCQWPAGPSLRPAGPLQGQRGPSRRSAPRPGQRGAAAAARQRAPPRCGWWQQRQLRRRACWRRAAAATPSAGSAWPAGPVAGNG